MQQIGSTIMYSTCTLSPEENEDVIAWILKKKEGGAVVLEGIFVSNLPLEDGLTRWKNREFGDEMKRDKRIAPSHDMERVSLSQS